MFLPKIDNWLFVNNSGDTYEIIAEGALNEESINNPEKWEELKRKYYREHKEQLKEERDKIIKRSEKSVSEACRV